MSVWERGGRVFNDTVGSRNSTAGSVKLGLVGMQ